MSFEIFNIGGKFKNLYFNPPGTSRSHFTYPDFFPPRVLTRTDFCFRDSLINFILKWLLILMSSLTLSHQLGSEISTILLCSPFPIPPCFVFPENFVSLLTKIDEKKQLVASNTVFQYAMKWCFHIHFNTSLCTFSKKNFNRNVKIVKKTCCVYRIFDKIETANRNFPKLTIGQLQLKMKKR